MHLIKQSLCPSPKKVFFTEKKKISFKRNHFFFCMQLWTLPYSRIKYIFSFMKISYHHRLLMQHRVTVPSRDRTHYTGKFGLRETSLLKQRSKVGDIYTRDENDVGKVICPTHYKSNWKWPYILRSLFWSGREFFSTNWRGGTHALFLVYELKDVEFNKMVIELTPLVTS